MCVSVSVSVFECMFDCECVCVLVFVSECMSVYVLLAKLLSTLSHGTLRYGFDAAKLLIFVTFSHFFLSYFCENFYSSLDFS